ncbi:hypothetical protein [Sinomonas mesophila]|uniref:hypothetical protein n=1 Tax=Sinomonas mesophila TaxID=1531955 RepID=UPI00098579FE|nr:hypothetical protein [Sinomonas mesophila]
MRILARGTGALAAAAAAAILLTGCQFFPSPYPPPCPAIAAAPFVSIEISPELAATIATLHGRGCQAGSCHEADLELLSLPGTPGRTAQLDMVVLTEDPIELTLTATGPGPGPTGRVTQTTAQLTFTPIAEYPFGQHCGKFVRAVVEWDAQGLRPKP